MTISFGVKGPALVTGAANGIGRASALALAAAGADVGVIDIEPEPLQTLATEIEQLGRRAVAVAADCTEGEAMAQAAASISQTLGPIEVLFNNVGQSARERASAFVESEEATWRFVTEVSLFTTLRMSRLIAPGMVERGSGRIVNMSSESAHYGDSGLVDYCAAKMGVIGFTRALARELAPSGITVNVVCPGAIRTRAHERLPADVVERIRQSVPLGHMGEPDDIAATVVFLASEAGRYITGQTLLVDGGRWMI